MKNYEEATYDYDFQMGRYMKEGWNIFKTAAGSFIGFTVVYFIIYFIVAVIPVLNLLSMFISTALLAGIFIFCRNLTRKKEDFSNFFEGFNYFGKIALFQLVLFLFFIPFLILIFTAIFPVSLIPDIISGDYNPEWLAEEIEASFENNYVLVSLIYLVFLAGTAYLYTSYSLTLPLIVDAKMDFWEAMETSRKVVGQNFFSFFGLYLVLVIILIVGTIFTCGLALLAMLPYINTVIFAAYNDIFVHDSGTLDSQVASFGGGEKDADQ